MAVVPETPPMGGPLPQREGADVLFPESRPARVVVPTRPQRRRFTARGIVRTGLLATTVAAAGVGAYEVAPTVINFVQEQYHNLTDPNYAATLHSNNGNYDLPAPSGRVHETPNSDAKPTIITADKVPHIKPITFSKITNTPLPSSNIGLDAYPNGDENAGFNPSAVISGYLVAIEKQPDNSYLFAVELPYLSGPQDILTKSVVSTTPDVRDENIIPPFELKNKVNEVIAGGVIVWIKPFQGTRSDFYPFISAVMYGDANSDVFSSINGLGKSAVGPNALYADIRVGDPIRAKIDLGMDFNSSRTINALNEYISNGHADNLADAATQMQKVLDQNMGTVNKIRSDAGRIIALADQLQGKRYIVTPNTIAFIPQATP